ncbi:MAG: hypothetical protein STSR0006_13090 [Lentimicrobium sp.]
MHKIVVTLKQHTPLIHFQHDQEGATLRATEVKPKLDRFILTKLGEDPDYQSKRDEIAKGMEEKFNKLNSYEKGKLIAKDLGWLIGKGEQPALDYKMKITSNRNDDNIKMRKEIKWVKDKQGNRVQDCDNNGNLLYKTAFPLILANMGGKKESEIVNFSFSNEIKILFSSFIVELINVIEKAIYEFFILNNFGNRCNKGFGSFTVEKINDTPFELDEQYFEENTFVLEFELKKPYNLNLSYFEKIFGVIDYFWRRLKPGINYRKNYIKSYLYKYINQKYQKTWEKQRIKKYFCLENTNNQNSNSNPPIFARALLGLPDKFEFKNQTVTIEITHPEIERIMAPIHFKPIIDGDKVTIYLLIKNEHFENLRLPTDFTFTNDNNSMTLPLDIEIDYYDFLKKYYNEFKSENFEFTPINYFGDNILDDNNKVKLYII